MYPDDATELAALIAALVPFVLGASAGLRAVLTSAANARTARWKRLNELAQVLYNKDHSSGLWMQIAAAHELGDTPISTKKAAIAILQSVKKAFPDDNDLVVALDAALSSAERGWARRALGFFGS